MYWSELNYDEILFEKVRPLYYFNFYLNYKEHKIVFKDIHYDDEKESYEFEIEGMVPYYTYTNIGNNSKNEELKYFFYLCNKGSLLDKEKYIYFIDDKFKYQSSKDIKLIKLHVSHFNKSSNEIEICLDTLIVDNKKLSLRKI